MYAIENLSSYFLHMGYTLYFKICNYVEINAIMIQKGTKVSWKWGNGTATGKVEETYTETVTKTIKGNNVTRHGEEGDKALYIKQDDGDYVLKGESEVERAD